MSATDTATKGLGDLADPATKQLGGIKIPSANALDKMTPEQKERELVQQRTDAAQAEKDKGSLKIHINLDLDVEVHLTARVKGDITIGLL